MTELFDRNILTDPNDPFLDYPTSHSAAPFRSERLFQARSHRSHSCARIGFASDLKHCAKLEAQSLADILRAKNMTIDAEIRPSSMER